MLSWTRLHACWGHVAPGGLQWLLAFLHRPHHQLMADRASSLGSVAGSCCAEGHQGKSEGRALVTGVHITNPRVLSVGEQGEGVLAFRVAASVMG